MSTEYEFTTAQAEAAVRYRIAAYHEAVPNDRQDTDELACTLTGMLGRRVPSGRVEIALDFLDAIAAVERADHDRVRLNESRTLDNRESLIEEFIGDFRSAVRDLVVASGFRTRWELAA
jgi:hypothetical protein